MSANGGQQRSRHPFPVMPSPSSSTRHAVSCQLLRIKPLLTVEPCYLPYSTCRYRQTRREHAKMRKRHTASPKLTTCSCGLLLMDSSACRSHLQRSMPALFVPASSRPKQHKAGIVSQSVSRLLVHARQQPIQSIDLTSLTCSLVCTHSARTCKPLFVLHCIASSETRPHTHTHTHIRHTTAAILPADRGRHYRAP